MDPLVCFNQHASFLFICIYNQLAMTNKMAARVLTYQLGSLSYDDSKLKRSKRQSSLSRFFRMRQRMVPFPTATNGK